jgi:hypothetical protein
MSQSVRLSDSLVQDARVAAKASEHSIGSQIEYWARLGRAIEPLLQGTQVLALCRSSSDHPLTECLDSVDTPAGRARVAAYLAAQPYPHFEPVQDSLGLLVR